jgi:hypothetical protein
LIHKALKSSHRVVHIFFSQNLSHLLPSSYHANPPKTHKNKNIINFLFFSFFNVVEIHYNNSTQSKKCSPKNNWHNFQVIEPSHCSVQNLVLKLSITIFNLGEWKWRCWTFFVPQHVPNNSSLYPISHFALSSTLVTYIIKSKGEITT